MSSKVLRSTEISKDSFLIENEPLLLPEGGMVVRRRSSGLFVEIDDDEDGAVHLGVTPLAGEQDSDGGLPEAADSEVGAAVVAPEPQLSPEELAQAQAQELLAAAEAQALSLVSEAQAQAEAVQDAARTAGYEAGYQAGLEDAQGLGQRAAGVVSEIAERLTREERRMVRSLEGRLSQLAIEIARKVIRTELRTGVDKIEELVRLTLHHFAEEEKVVIRLNPADLEHLRGCHTDITTLFDPSGAVKIIEDRRVSRGGCVVESPSGRLDARPEAQLDRVAEVFEVEASYGSESIAVVGDDSISDTHTDIPRDDDDFYLAEAGESADE